MSALPTCLFLHSSTDKPRVAELVKYCRDLIPALQCWYDERDIGNDDDIDPQILQKIDEARVIVFCVGESGLGQYQSAVELPLVLKRKQEAARNDGRKLRL